MTTKPFGPFRLPADEVDAIRKAAAAEKRSMTSFIRAACADRIKSQEDIADRIYSSRIQGNKENDNG